MFVTDGNGHALDCTKDSYNWGDYSVEFSYTVY